MKQKLLLKTMLLLFALIAGTSTSWGVDVTGTINFGSASGSTAISGSSSSGTGPVTYTDSGNDSKGNTWTITTVTNNEKSFTQNASYSQVGANGKGVSSITFTTTLSESQTIKGFSAKFGGFSGTAGTITLKVGDTTVGSGSLNAGTDVTVSATNTTTSGTVLTVIVTPSASKGVKAYYISYTYDDGTVASVTAPSISPDAGAVTAGTTVTLTQAAADQIRYTTDGTDPTKTTGTVYSTPIAITTPTTIKAIAIKGDDVSSVATAAYTISVAAPTFSPESGSYLVGTTFTLASASNTVYYNIKTDGSTPSDPTNASTEYTGPIALVSGTTKIKAIAYDTYGNASSIEPRTYTGIAPASLPFSWTGTESAGKQDLDDKTGVEVSLSSDYGTDKAPYRLKFDAVGKSVTIYANEKPEIFYFTAKILNASTSSKMKVQASTNGVEFRDVQEFEVTGDANATFEFTTTNAFNADERVARLVMSSKETGVNVAVGTIAISGTTFPITPAKTYTTLTSAYPLDFTSVSSDLKAFIATTISDSKVQMTQVNKVPAGTGLVLKATTPGSAINVPVLSGAADDVSGNKMAGSAFSTTAIAANGGYILKNGIFQPASAGTLAAGKAYLAIAVSSASELKLDFEGGSTGIDSIKNGTLKIENGVFYNLAGQRVAQPTKGLYIVNGRKVVIK